jgi:hypothetical protein
MIRLAAILSLLILSSPFVASQEVSRPVINGNYPDLPFSQFAAAVKRDHGIDIFYRNEWISDIRITATGDSIDLTLLLSKALGEKGINLFYNGKRQYFLTGSMTVDDERFTAVAETRQTAAQPDSVNRSLFARHSYEKSIRRVTVGDKNSITSSGNALLSGKITSVNSGEPVPGATVIVDGATTGAVTNGEGQYALQLRSAGVYNINISCLGMEKESYIVEMNSSGTLDIELQEQLIDIQEAVVRSGRNDNVRGMQMGFQRIDIKEIKSIPVVMGERDIIKIAQMMPGVQTVGEGASGFNVRGSTSDQNLFLLNKIPILNTGHLFGFFSAFNPDMISDFNLYKSNFPAEYGGRLASVFEVSTRKGNKKNFGARGAISPVTGSLLIETPIVTDKSSLIVGGRSTYSDWILRQLDDIELNKSAASFQDLMSGLHIIIDESSSIQLFGYYSRDKFRLAGTNSYRYENIGSSAIYNRKLNELWIMEAAAVYSRYNNYHANSEMASKAYEHLFRVDHKELKMKITGYKWLNHSTTFGAGAIRYDLDHGTLNPFGPGSLISPTPYGSEKGMEFNAFMSDEYAVTHRLSVYGGLRYSHFSLLGPGEIYTYPSGVPREAEFISDTTSYNNGERIKSYSGPEYRISLNFEFTPDLSLKASYNRMRQYLFMLSNTIAMSPTDRWKLTDSYIRPPVSDQVSLGLYKNIPRSALETSAEIYIKKTRNQVDYKDGADLSLNPRFETSILQGEQDSWGAELFVKRNAGRFTGWVSYAWSRSMITVDGEYDWDKINDGKTYPANFDKPHSLNLVSNYRFSRRISLATNLVYSTGRPVTYPKGVFVSGGEQGIVYSNRNEYRIPDYFRIDVSLNLEGNLRKEKLAHGSWMFAIYNLTGRRNAYSVYFKTEGGRVRGYKQSIYGVPIFTISYNFKLGNYAVD